jgi:hypothetical protein
MPVNDDPWPLSETNCALCCIAGLVGTTAATERDRMTKQLGGVRDQETITAEYGRKKMAKGLTSGSDLEAQVAGVMHYMLHVHQIAAQSVVGGFNNRLSAEDVTAAIGRYPVGTGFLYLVTAGPGRAGAHWIVARKNQGGVDYTDYQLDVAAETESSENLMRFNRGKCDPGRFGSPSVTDKPMEAFGKSSGLGNRMIVIAFGKPKQVFKSSRALIEGK